MSGDKIQRVKSVKRWLEKAEASYTSHKEISGELNLIMAQAEMQRLKETQKPSSFRKWSLRGAAMAVAVILFAGFHAVVTPKTQAPPAISPPQEVVVIKSEPTAEEIPKSQTITETPEVKEAQATVQEAPAPVYSEPAPTPGVATAVAAEPVYTAPVLSESEIQSVVGEAGRALRGQS